MPLLLILLNSTDPSIFNAFYVMKKFSILVELGLVRKRDVSINHLSRVRYSLHNFDFEVEVRIRSIFIQLRRKSFEIARM